MTLPALATRETILERLPLIFPEGTPNRQYCIREVAANTIFVMLYIGAIEGSGHHLGPVHVYRMTNEQAAKTDDASRSEYRDDLRKKSFTVPGTPWYADNTREQVRDESLRDGLVSIGAVARREDLPTTSGLGRYSLKPAFAALFDPDLQDEKLEAAIGEFQKTHLSSSALARISIMQSGAAGSSSGVLVTFPSHETRMLAPGPSSIIAKAVVEDFAGRFLSHPAVLWLSESGNKVALRDDKLAAQLGLKIEADKNLPDLILADVGAPEAMIVFVEVVATDGAITAARKEALLKLTDAAGFSRKNIAFVTAYQDRESAGFKKTMHGLAWGSFAWFLSEPENVLHMRDGASSSTKLSDVIGS